MDPHCIPLSEVPHTSSLLTDFLRDFPRVAPFYSHDPSDPESFARSARQISLEESRRSFVTDVLAEQNDSFGVDPTTQENIARLRKGNAFAVVTGQQAGLFGGPAYSVYKALTAIRLAQDLSGRGIPSVPVFWLASEDHDFAEVNHTSLVDGGGGLLEVRDGAAPPANAPVGTILFDSRIEEARQAVRNLWPRESAEDAQAFLTGYQPGRSYVTGFARLFRQLFSGMGLVLLDPLHPALHALGRPLFRRALEEAGGIRDLLRERSRALDKAGYHIQVKMRENATLVFLLTEGRRLPLRRRKEGFVVSGQEEMTLDTLLEQLEAEPGRFSPNVLLRPLVQDSLLPTVAYVAGPNEIAYFAQASVLYEKFLGRMPVIVPRASLTLVDQKSQRLLTRYGLSLRDVWRGENSVRLRVAERRLPARLLKKLERAEGKVGKILDETAEVVKALDPTLAGAVDTSRRKISYQFGKIRRKAARAQAEREEIVERHVRALLNNLYPHRGLQERTTNFLSFIARHGPDLVPRLLAEVSFPCRDHQVIFL